MPMLDNTTDFHSGTLSEIFPHTDGSYLDGFMEDKQGIYKLEPPKLLVIQKMYSSYLGGDLYLVDAKPILEDLIKDNKFEEYRNIVVSYIRTD